MDDLNMNEATTENKNGVIARKEICRKHICDDSIIDEEETDVSNTNSIDNDKEKIVDDNFLSTSSRHTGYEPLQSRSCEDINTCACVSTPITRPRRSVKSGDSKLKRNTMHLPASYKVEAKEKKNMSKSLPSLIESSVQNTHSKDITSTPLYKEIYTNNIRQYSFLLAKKLGTSNQSPQALRKAYNQNRQKAVARGAVCAPIAQRDFANRPLPPTPSNEDESLSDNSSVDSEPVTTTARKISNTTGKNKGSFTDISRIITPNEHRPLSLELSTALEINRKTVDASHLSEGIGNLDLYSKSEDECYDGVESTRLARRKRDADLKRRVREARLNSLDDMVIKSSTFLKNLKSKKDDFSNSMEVF